MKEKYSIYSQKFYYLNRPFIDFDIINRSVITDNPIGYRIVIAKILDNNDIITRIVSKGLCIYTNSMRPMVFLTHIKFDYDMRKDIFDHEYLLAQNKYKQSIVIRPYCIDENIGFYAHCTSIIHINTGPISITNFNIPKISVPYKHYNHLHLIG